MVFVAIAALVVTAGCGAVRRTDRELSRSAAFFGGFDRTPARVADAGPKAPQPTHLVTSAGAEGPGTLRQAILDVNESGGPAHIGVAAELLPLKLDVAEELPTVRAGSVLLDLAGVTLSGLEECRRRSGRPGCNGLVVEGPAVEVRGLRSEGFVFDGISVRGARARDVAIVECVARGNLDDGVGISDHAGPVLVERSVLVGNGFDPKGKGVLVFDYASAVLIDNVIAANRDGVTVGRGARARLERNVIAHNFDKGLGARAGTIGGRDNVIVGNGAAVFEEPAPNADALRATLGSRVYLENTVIEGNGDAGVVAADEASVVLEGGRIIGNGGVGVVAADSAFVDLRGVEIFDNGGLDVHRAGANARVLRSRPLSDR